MSKLRYFVLLITVSTSVSVLAQEESDYDLLVKQAYQSYDTKEFRKSALFFSKAFAISGDGHFNDRYNAACSWALANEADSAFVQLVKIAKEMGYADLDHLKSDPDLNMLHTDARWKKLVKLVGKNKQEQEKHYDKKLVKQLQGIYESDQSHRQQINALGEKYGWESPQMDSMWKIISYQDSINLIRISHILDTRGWLGPDVISPQGNITLFLVIQHADLATQQKYLPMMREAVSKGNAQGSSLALLEDRVALREGRKQIYGSQIGRNQETGEAYVLPLEDPDQVDERRKTVGLGPIATYVEYFGIVWNLEAYKEKLPYYESLQKRTD